MERITDGAAVAVAAIEEEREQEEVQYQRCHQRIHKSHPLNLWLYIRHVSHTFGTKFTILLFCNYFFMKGVVYVFIQGVQLPFYRILGVGGTQYQTFSVVALTPWAMKGLIGTMSDSFALGGYHKRYYMVLCCACGCLALCLLGFLPIEVSAHHLWIPPILFFFVMFEIATLDLLIEGKYTEKMRVHPETNSDLVTFVWVCITLGSLAASGVVGLVADHLGPTALFWMCIPLALHLIPALLCGFLPEHKVDCELRNKFQVRKIKEQGPFFMLAVTTAAGALILAVLSLVGSPAVQASYSIIASFILIGLGFVAMPRQLALCNFYMYTQECLYISLSGALDFWYTAKPACVPNGPAFDYTYYQTYSQLVGHSASVIGLWIFQTTMSRWKFRYVYWFTTCLRVLASFFDLIIVKRWNLRIGLADRWMYLLGDAIVVPITGMLNFMPGVLLTAKLCPHSVEATVYAILAGFSNFGANTARAIGACLQKVAGINTQEPECNFDRLPLLIMICHCVTPLISLLLAFVLLPNTRMNEPLVEDSTTVSTTESEDAVNSNPSISSVSRSTNWTEWRRRLVALVRSRILMVKMERIPSRESASGSGTS